MPCNTRLARFLIASGSGVLIAGTLVSQPAASAPVPSTSITILLKAPDQAGLDRLATAQGLDHAQRVAALATLLPSAATHQDVATTLRSDGFTVTAQTAWTVTAQAP